MRSRRIWSRLVIALALVLVSRVAVAGQSIHVLPADDEAMKATATELSGLLRRISGEECTVSGAPFGGEGFVLALRKSWRGELPVPERDADHPERVWVKSDGKHVAIVGNTQLAVRHGVFIYLEALGCRWLAPGERWTVIPPRKSVFVEMETTTRPDYRDRRIWYAYGFGWGKKWKSQQIGDDYRGWMAANRMGGAAPYQCGHSWDGILAHNKKAFDEHPEYFALKQDGQRYDGPNPKFCCSNEGLIELVAADRIATLEKAREKNPRAFMVSVDPSDGYGYCMCEQCRKLGNSSDRVLHLANEVAKRLRAKHPDAWVGLYAYADHQIPPTIEVEPNVYVQMAMGFNKTGLSFSELIRAWGAKAGALGIREYYSVMAWDFNLPGRGRGGRVAYHRKQIPFWLENSATSVNAESSNNWAAMGLGYYVAAKLMWDAKADVDAIVADYYKNAFGPAAKRIRALHEMWLPGPPLLNGTICTWLDTLREAAEQTEDEAIQARLTDLKAYLHYVVLMHEFRSAVAGDDARAKYLRLMEYAFRIKTRNMMHSYALARRIANGKFPASILYKKSDGANEAPKDIATEWRVFAKDCPWQKNTDELTDAEVNALFSQDVEKYKAFEGTVKTYSRDLIPPPRPLKGTNDGRAKKDSYRFKTVFYVLFDRPEIDVELAGVRSASLVLSDVQADEELLKVSVKKGENQRVTLRVPELGLYKVAVDGWYSVVFPDDVRYVLEASPSEPCQPTPYAGPCYFYVPKGTKTFTVSYGARLIVKSPDGKARTYQSKTDPHPAVIDVGDGNDGKLWSIGWLTAGRFFFLDIPPFVSLTPGGYLGPKEVF